MNRVFRTFHLFPKPRKLFPNRFYSKKRRLIKFQNQVVDIYADNRSKGARYLEKFFLWTFCICGIGVPAVVIFYGLERVPYSGRRRLLLAPQKLDSWLGELALTSVLEDENVLSDDDKTYPQCETVQDVFYSIIKSNELDRNFEQFNFDVFIIEKDEKNAFCVPGGKMVVYTGMFEICETEEDLAILLGHEIAHAVARHSVEAIQTKALFFVTAYAIGLSMGVDIFTLLPDYATKICWGLVHTLLHLPQSRRAELEADAIGLKLAANAGYDAHHAPAFYEKLGEVEAQIPEFLSTHPVSETRVEEIKKQLENLK